MYMCTYVCTHAHASLSYVCFHCNTVLQSYHSVFGSSCTGRSLLHTVLSWPWSRGQFRHPVKDQWAHRAIRREGPGTGSATALLWDCGLVPALPWGSVFDGCGLAEAGPPWARWEQTPCLRWGHWKPSLWLPAAVGTAARPSLFMMLLAPSGPISELFFEI